MTSILERIGAQRLVGGVDRGPELTAAVDALVAAGVAVVELALDSDAALGALARLRARGDVGVVAGSVRTPAQAEAAIEAGAEAISSPALVLEVLEACRALAIPAFPGAITPTEVEQAWGLGASLVRLFPAGPGGPDYVRTLRGALPEVGLLAAGGIGAGNAAAFLAAGAVAVVVPAPEAAAAAEALSG